MNYKKLRKKFKAVLGKIGEAEIESWLKFDEERIRDKNMKWKVLQSDLWNNKTIKVEIMAEILDLKENKIVEYITEGYMQEEDEHPGIYSWEEGNFSCDCNRCLFYTNHKVDFDCNENENRFKVNLKNVIDNKYFYKEF